MLNANNKYALMLKKKVITHLILITILQFIGFNDTDYNSDISLTNSIKKISISSDHKHIALLNNDNIIWIGSSDLRKVYRIYRKSFSSSIDQMAWYYDYQYLMYLVV